MDIKILFAGISVVVGFVSLVAYFKDILKGKTQPHLYTWLIWAITEGTATVAVWYGGGGLGAIHLTIGTISIIFVLFFSLISGRGSKNITRSDKVALMVALLAILVWWRLKNPVLAVFMVSGIDVIGYLPTFRKSYQEPWSESAITWLGFVAANVFAILALGEYNLLTLPYLISISTANIILIAICLIRRPLAAKPALTK